MARAEPTEDLQPTQEVFDEGMMEPPTEAVPTQLIAASEPPTQDLGRSQRQPRSLEEWVQLGAAFAEQRNKASRTSSAKKGRGATSKMGPPAPSSATRRASRPVPTGKPSAQLRSDVKAAASSMPPTQEIESTQEIQSTQELAAEPAPPALKCQPPQVARPQGRAVASAPVAVRPPPLQVASQGEQVVAKKQEFVNLQSTTHPGPAAPKKFEDNVDRLLASVQQHPHVQQPSPVPSVPGHGAKVYRRQARASLRDQAGPRTREAADMHQRPEVHEEEMLTQELTPASQDPAVHGREAPVALATSLATFGAPSRSGGISAVVLPPKRRSFIELVQLGHALREKTRGGAPEELAPEGPAGGALDENDAEACQPAKRLRLTDGAQALAQEELLPPTEELPPAGDGQDCDRVDSEGEASEEAEDDAADAKRNPSFEQSVAAVGDVPEIALAIADVEHVVSGSGGGACNENSGLVGAASDVGIVGPKDGKEPDEDLVAQAAAADLAAPFEEAVTVAPGAADQSSRVAPSQGSTPGGHSAGEAAAAVELVVSMLRQQRSGGGDRGADAGAEQAERLLQGLLPGTTTPGSAGAAAQQVPAPPPAPAVSGDAAVAAAEVQAATPAAALTATPAAPVAAAAALSPAPVPGGGQQLATMEAGRQKRRKSSAATAASKIGLVGIDAIEASVRELEEKEEETREQLSALISQKASSVEETVRELQRRKEAVVGVLNSLKDML